MRVKMQIRNILHALLAAATAVAAGGCSLDADDILFSEFELDFIKNNLVFDGDLPSDSTNQYHDDADAASLGQKFWFDPAFSGEIQNSENPLYNGGGVASEGQISCDSCHVAANSFIDRVSTPDETSLGSNWTPRHTPTVLNTAYIPFAGWDGRKDSTWSMVLAPIEAGAVANFGRLATAEVICDNYLTDYEAIFGDTGASFCTTVTSAMDGCDAVSLLDAYAADTGVTVDYRGRFANAGAAGATTEGQAYFNTGDSTTYIIDGGGFEDAVKEKDDCTSAELDSTLAADDGAAGTTCVDTAGHRTYGSSGDTCFAGTDSDGNNVGLSTANQTAVNEMFANFGKAVAAYERLLVDENSEFDKWAKGKSNSMSTDAKRGLQLFIGKANCIQCHNGPRFTDDEFHNIGIPQGGFAKTDDNGRSDGIASVLDDTFNSDGDFSDDTNTGRLDGLAAGDADIGAFKTPTLRSISKTGPYMHTGQFASLWDVVEFYNFGGNNDGFPGDKDSAMIPRNLTDEEITYLIEFLKSLDGAALDDNLLCDPADADCDGI